jgi:ABC-type transporter Mla MlaB component/anti-sigma regulatory factor (Ser/Thr protein kinase)
MELRDGNLEVALQGHMTVGAVEAVVSRMAAASPRSGRALCIDLRRVQMVDAPAVALLLIALGHCRPLYSERLLLLPQDQGVIRYLEHLAFFAYASQYCVLNRVVGDRPPRSSATIPLTRIVPSSDSGLAERQLAVVANLLADRLPSMLSRVLTGPAAAPVSLAIEDLHKAGITDDEVRLVGSSLELCKNIQMHAGEEGFVVAASRRRRDGGLGVMLAVADRGLGIRQTLSARYPEVAKPEGARRALWLAVQKGTSARPVAERGGLGLYLVLRYALEHGWRFSLRTEDTRMWFSQGQPRWARVGWLPGTQAEVSVTASPP